MLEDKKKNLRSDRLRLMAARFQLAKLQRSDQSALVAMLTFCLINLWELFCYGPRGRMNTWILIVCKH